MDVRRDDRGYVCRGWTGVARLVRTRLAADREAWFIFPVASAALVQIWCTETLAGRQQTQSPARVNANLQDDRAYTFRQ